MHRIRLALCALPLTGIFSSSLAIPIFSQSRHLRPRAKYAIVDVDGGIAGNLPSSPTVTSAVDDHSTLASSTISTTKSSSSVILQTESSSVTILQTSIIPSTILASSTMTVLHADDLSATSQIGTSRTPDAAPPIPITGAAQPAVPSPTISQTVPAGDRLANPSRSLERNTPTSIPSMHTLPTPKKTEAPAVSVSSLAFLSSPAPKPSVNPVPLGQLLGSSTGKPQITPVPNPLSATPLSANQDFVSGESPQPSAAAPNSVISSPQSSAPIISPESQASTQISPVMIQPQTTATQQPSIPTAVQQGNSITSSGPIMSASFGSPVPVEFSPTATPSASSEFFQSPTNSPVQSSIPPSAAVLSGVISHGPISAPLPIWTSQPKANLPSISVASSIGIFSNQYDAAPSSTTTGPAFAEPSTDTTHRPLDALQVQSKTKAQTPSPMQPTSSSSWPTTSALLVQPSTPTLPPSNGTFYPNLKGPGIPITASKTYDDGMWHTSYPAWTADSSPRP